MSALGVDDVEGGRRAARHLTELGHRRFAVLSLALADTTVGAISWDVAENALYSGTRDRLRGYAEVLTAAGIPLDSVPLYETDNDCETTAAGLEHFFASGTPPTAILAMSDKIALHALDWLSAQGISVPGDVSIVGFDGVPEGEVSEPPLTTIAQPMAEMGRRAVRQSLPSTARSAARRLTWNCSSGDRAPRQAIKIG